MNIQALSQVISELSRLSRASIDRVYEDAEKNIIVVLRKDRKNFFLLISPDRSLPRLHLVQKKPPASASMHPFTLYLKSRSSGGRIIAFGLLNRDRIASIRFLRQGAEHELIIEILGRNANLLLCDADRKILSVYHGVPPSESSTRVLLPGAVYQLPHAGHHLAIGTTGSTEQTAVQTSGMTANENMERHFNALLNERTFSSARIALASLVKKGLKKSERLLQNLTQDKSWAENAESYRTSGDLILANLDRLRAGMKQAFLTGYDGTTRTVTLDPLRSPKRNAELCFKKYKKAKAGRNIIEKRLQDAQSEIQLRQSLLNDLESARNEEDLLAVRSSLERKGYVRPSLVRKIKKNDPRENASFRKIFYNGWEIVVGKSAAGNDHITTRIARPDDVWLHAEGLPGSHVVVRNPEKKKLPEDVLLKAASLAAYYSKGRSSGKVAVAYTSASNVKKPKGARPGLVFLIDRKSIVVTPGQE